MKRVLSLLGTVALMATGIAGYTKAYVYDSANFSGTVAVVNSDPVSQRSDLRLSADGINYDSKSLNLGDLRVEDNGTRNYVGFYAKNTGSEENVSYMLQLSGTQGGGLLYLNSIIEYKNISQNGQWTVAKPDQGFTNLMGIASIDLNNTDTYEVRMTVYSNQPVQGVSAYHIELVEVGE